MPSGWIHDALDLIVFGRVYRQVHALKDLPSQRYPGIRHREIFHDWYWSFGKQWDFKNPFPASLQNEIEDIQKTEGADVAEARQSSDSHDYFDRIWDFLSKPERLYWQGFFLWLLFDPALLRSWAGVDVEQGRILREIDGIQRWEASPETTIEYLRLRKYVSKNHKHRLRKSGVEQFM